MKRRTLPLLLAGGIILSLGPGCVAPGPPGLPPPPGPIVEAQINPPYPGAVWVGGEWHWHPEHRRYEWHGGHWR